MQEKLLPDDKPNLELREVRLQELPSDAGLFGPAPERALIDSIERWGLLEPPIIYGEPGHYRVHAGRRRIKALRVLSKEWAERMGKIHEQGVHEEPNPYGKVKVFYADTEESAAAFITLTEQAVRRDNVAADIEAIEELLRQGLDEKQIAAAVGMSTGRVKARIRLAQNLMPVLLAGLKMGNIKPSVAEAAAKLGRSAQGRLMALYSDKGKLKMADVEEERRRRVESASKQVEFDMPGMDELGIPEDAAPLTPPTESVGYLRGRLKEIRTKDQAKWTRKDLDALEALLTNL
jgi:ParB-like chromosome segregation protein Spo0J